MWLALIVWRMKPLNWQGSTVQKHCLVDNPHFSRCNDIVGTKIVGCFFLSFFKLIFVAIFSNNEICGLNHYTGVLKKMIIELKWIRIIQEYVKITKCNFSIIKFKTSNREILPDIWYHIRKIIVYSQSTINTYSLLSYKWWVLLVKFMVEPTIHIR